ncbi:MAG: GIY-YIG nuclease family protein [Anaerolineae bacterium]|nr:GIY-YIG nuclease family protein [Anaerolineae bacterium]
MWYLYVLRCNDGSFYTGSTHDVGRRVGEHQAGRGRATRVLTCRFLLYCRLAV